MLKELSSQAPFIELIRIDERGSEYFLTMQSLCCWFRSAQQAFALKRRLLHPIVSGLAQASGKLFVMQRSSEIPTPALIPQRRIPSRN